MARKLQLQRDPPSVLSAVAMRVHTSRLNSGANVKIRALGKILMIYRTILAPLNEGMDAVITQASMGLTTLQAG